MNALELFEAIGNMDDESIRLCLPDETEPEQIAEQGIHCNPPPVKQKTAKQRETNFPGITLLPYLLTAGCTAACIAGFGLMIRFSMGNEIVGTQSEIPISVQESVSSMTTAVSTGERAVLTAITETHTVQQTVTVTAEDRTEPVSVTETDAVTEPAAAMTAMQTETLLLTETAAAETQTEPLPLTGTATAETQTETTVTEPPPPVYEMGDVDMDGQITFVDAALVKIDVHYAHNSSEAFTNGVLTDKQRLLGNADGSEADEYGVLTDEDAEIIYQTAKLRRWYETELTAEEYAGNSAYYQALERAYTEEMLLQSDEIRKAWYQSFQDADQLYKRMAIATYGIMIEYDDSSRPDPDAAWDMDYIEKAMEQFGKRYSMEDFYQMADKVRLIFREEEI